MYNFITGANDTPTPVVDTTPAVDTTTNTTTVTADEPPSKKPRTFKRKPAADATPAN